MKDADLIRDVYIERAVCNKKCKHGLRRDFFFTSISIEKIIYSIRLVPGSSPGQPIGIFKCFRFGLALFLVSLISFTLDHQTFKN